MTQSNSPSHASASSSVLRRYTPPTCTLEISAKSSSLSKWVGKPTLKNLRFKLSFDDPRVSDDQWITLRGDRSQLDALSEAVATYVQGFLNQSHRLVMQTTGSAEGTAIATLDPPPIPSSEAAHLTSPHRIALQPKGLLAHTLLLGTLANDRTGATVSLTSTQLADLATALDEYAADVTALPSLAKPAWMQSPTVWGRVAAGLLVAVGLSASMLNGLNRSASNGTPQTSQGASSSDQRIALQPLPSPSSPPNSFLTTPAAPLLTLPPNGKPPLVTVPTTPPLGSIQPSIVQPPAPSFSESRPTGTTPQPATKTPPQVEIFQVPAAKAPANSSASPRSVPVPPIVDQLGSEPLPSGASAKIRAGASAESSAQNSALAAQPEKTQVQVTAIKRYFQGKWKPPSGLDGGLEYVLQLDANGRLQSVQERNEDSTTYRQQSGIPAIGESMAPPAPDGKSSVIFLRLDPDGGVQVIKQQSTDN